MRRLIALCDGSWLGDANPRPSNVAHLARLVLPVADDGVTQLVHYQYSPMHAGADARSLARSIDADIQSMYRFLVLNHAPGDEIYLFGASRGAYIARSVVGLLRNSWLLRREHAELVPQAYHVYRTLWHADADNALQFREPRADPVTVRFVGCWDTVGKRGIPLALFDGLDAERYAFHDTVLSRIVEHAAHALAIDEQRRVLEPCLWKTRGDRSRTQQVWFSGSHHDVGGGNRDAGLAWISLRWMIEQAAQCGLRIDAPALQRLCATHAQESVHNSLAGQHASMDALARGLCRTNADEALHASAEQRFMRRRRYRPQNLVEYLARDEQIRLPL